jgi:surfeit locus 1 family protein
MRAIRPLLPAALATLVAFAILIALGNWQIRRLAWKEALIARVDARTKAAPVPLPPPADWAGLDMDEWEYRPVALTGQFRNDLESRDYALIEQRGRFGGPGYWVMTPLDLDGGGRVLVNRGFVPLDRADPATRPAGQVEGPVTVRGLLRVPEHGGLFTPAATPEKRLFYARDPQAIAAALGLGAVAPFTVDADATPNPGGLPQGGETVVTFPNDHLQYALTWYGLAAALLCVFGVWARGALRRNRRRSDAYATHPSPAP